MLRAYYLGFLLLTGMPLGIIGLAVAWFYRMNRKTAGNQNTSRKIQTHGGDAPNIGSQTIVEAGNLSL